MFAQSTKRDFSQSGTETRSSSSIIIISIVIIIISSSSSSIVNANVIITWTISAGTVASARVPTQWSGLGKSPSWACRFRMRLQI